MAGTAGPGARLGARQGDHPPEGRHGNLPRRQKQRMGPPDRRHARPRKPAPGDVGEGEEGVGA